MRIPCLNFFWPLFSLACFWLASCASSSQPSANIATDSTQLASLDTAGLTEEGAFSFDQMFKLIREKRMLMVVYGSQEPQHIQTYQNIGKQIKQSFDKFQVVIKSDEELTESDLMTYPAFFIGSPTSNRWIPEMLKNSPFTLLDTGFAFNNKSYKDPSYAFAIGMYPNPKAHNMPFSLMTANDDAKLIDLLQYLYGANWRRAIWGSMGYQIFKDKQRVVMGDFSKEPNKSWTVDQKVHWDFETNTALLQETKHFRVITHGNIPSERANAFIAACESNIAYMEKQLGYTGTPQRIDCHLYASSEEKGLFMENSTHSHVKFDRNEVHTVLSETYNGNEIGTEHQLLLRQILGQPQANALEEGLAIYFAPKWQIHGALYWMARLQVAGQYINLSELLDNEVYEQNSRLTFNSAAGTMIAFLIAEWGEKDFYEKYAKWNPDQSELQALEVKWRQYLQKLPAKYPQKSIAQKKQPYARGFNFAHEGYRIYNGYGSALANRSIDHLKELNTNSLAIVPYTYMPDPHKPNFLRFSEWAGGENDESVAHSAHYAQTQGMSVLLKPQIWLGGGSWPGDLQMTNEQDWQTFFRYYNRWISHYAMLAEIHQMEAFCIGVEFAKATIERPAEWQQMAKSMRAIFQGKLTYAANWGEEVENINFWESFDYIGVNCYYPLSKREDPDDAALAEGFQHTLDKLEKILLPYKRPVVFTEIGFRSVDHAWKNPHAEAEGRAVNMDTQARCYRVVCDALAKTPWCQGLYWWKWPSYMEYSQHNLYSFSPMGKPAEKVIKQWFQQQKP